MGDWCKEKVKKITTNWDRSRLKHITPCMKWVEWSVFQIMVGNHQLQPYFSHQRAEIWPTCPKSESYLKAHLTIYMEWIELSVFQIMFGSHRLHSFFRPPKGEIWPMRPKEESWIVSSYKVDGFYQFHEIWLKTEILALKNEALAREMWRRDRRTDRHRVLIELLHAGKMHLFSNVFSGVNMFKIRFETDLGRIQGSNWQ